MPLLVQMRMALAPVVPLAHPLAHLLAHRVVLRKVLNLIRLSLGRHLHLRQRRKGRRGTNKLNGWDWCMASLELEIDTDFLLYSFNFFHGKTILFNFSCRLILLYLLLTIRYHSIIFVYTDEAWSLELEARKLKRCSALLNLCFLAPDFITIGIY